ncbi:high mobility group B protein 15 isoform X1 [Dendrobium catenatum]|uniref:High mobility group B protein 15 n=1 Tax=Dendrobium catenatum TaxID=906689 RepID=A0A2I0WBK9_9ASPA|nr:high mobility group B protein 15 isoform X1 [Dendrobium catenatum]PKU73044.1 High mobility group B protein 15 [Dendrobium catenatum]
MSVDKGQSSPITTSPPLAAVPIQSQPPVNSAQPTATEATASYEDVVSDEVLFLATLEALHRSLGTKFMVPRVGGRPLNLHRLFVEVTSRGGLQKVIRDRIWKDVISAFNFPSTITNASFVLRKYYISLLQHYEEVYFFRNKDPIDPITGTNYGSPSASKPNQVGTTGAHGTSGKHLADSSSGEVLIDQEPLKQQDPTKIAQQKNSTGLQLPGYPPLEIGSWLRGEITGKFENGYLVTAIYGSEKLTGVLYHAHSDGSQSQTLSSSSSGQRRRKRSSQAIEEHSLSKSNSCNLYFDHGVKVNPSLSTEEKKISKQLGDLWNRLTQPSNEDNQETESEG